MEPEYRVVRPRHVHLGLGHHVGLDAVEHAQHGEAVLFSPFKDFLLRVQGIEAVPFCLLALLDTPSCGVELKLKHAFDLSAIFSERNNRNVLLRNV